MNPSYNAIAQQRFLVLRSYSIYRFFLSLGLLTLIWSGMSLTLIGDTSDYFLTACYGMATLSTLGLSLLFRQQFDPSNPEVVGWLITDIVVLYSLAATSGAATSVLLPLFMVVVAVGGILLEGQLNLLIASMATIALLALATLFKGAGVDSKTMFSAGAWGIGLFSLALSVRFLASRLYRSIDDDAQKAAIIQELQAINSRIIDRMNTGVIVVGNNKRLLQVNPAARRLLNASHSSLATIEDLAELNFAYQRWLASPTEFSQNIEVGPDQPLKVGFVEFAERGDVLIFIEDALRTRYRAEQMKLASLGRLSAGIAHEIRNPLAAISYARQLLEQSASLATDDQELLATIARQEERIDGIIEKTFDLAKTKPAQHQRIKLPHFMASLLDEYAEIGKFSSRDITVDFGSLNYAVEFDQDHLRQILFNLFDNANRHGQLPVLISGRETLGSLAIDIIDQGTALESDEASKLFDPFFSKSSDSTGLGLYICRQLCQVNRAALIYGSHEGRSRFSLITSVWSKLEPKSIPTPIQSE